MAVSPRKASVAQTLLTGSVSAIVCWLTIRRRLAGHAGLVTGDAKSYRGRHQASKETPPRSDHLTHSWKNSLVDLVPGEPDRDFFDSARRSAERAEDKLAVGLPFRVAGLAVPAVEPAWLAEWSSVSMTVEEISLFYGRMDAPSGPAVTVSTSIIGDYGRQLNSLEYELADERDRLYDHAGIDEADPSDPPVHLAAALVIDGASVEVDVCRHGGLWAARAELPAPEPGANNNRLVVTVVARGVPFEDLELTSVEDLRPFVVERRRVIDERRAAGPPPRPEPIIPPDPDLYRALIDETLREAREIEQAHAEGRPPSPRPRSSGQQRHALWQAAVESHSRSRGLSTEQSNAAVTTMVNQMVQLAEAAPWFGDAALRNAAIDESLAYAARGEVVRSQRAQDTWQALWSRGQSLAPATLAREARDRSLADRSRWLQEWDLWVMERGR